MDIVDLSEANLDGDFLALKVEREKREVSVQMVANLFANSLINVSKLLRNLPSKYLTFRILYFLNIKIIIIKKIKQK